MASWIPFPNRAATNPTISSDSFTVNMPIKCTVEATAPNVSAPIVDTLQATVQATSEILDIRDEVLARDSKGESVDSLVSFLNTTTFAPPTYTFPQGTTLNPWSIIPIADLLDTNATVNGQWLGWLLSCIGADLDYQEFNQQAAQNTFPSLLNVKYDFGANNSWKSDIEDAYALWSDKNNADVSGWMKVGISHVPGSISNDKKGILIGILLSYWGQQPYNFVLRIMDELVIRGLLNENSSPITPFIEASILGTNFDIGYWTGHRGFGRGGLFDVDQPVETDFAVGWNIDSSIPENERYYVLTCQQDSCGDCNNLEYTWMIQTLPDWENNVTDRAMAWYYKPDSPWGCPDSYSENKWVYSRDYVSFDLCNTRDNVAFSIQGKKDEVTGFTDVNDATTYLNNNNIPITLGQGGGFLSPPSSNKVDGAWLGWLLTLWGTTITGLTGSFYVYRQAFGSDPYKYYLNFNIPNRDPDWGALLGFLLSKWQTNSDAFYAQLTDIVRDLPEWDDQDSWTCSYLAGAQPFWDWDNASMSNKTHSWTDANPPNPAWIIETTNATAEILWYPNLFPDGSFFVPSS